MTLKEVKQKKLKVIPIRNPKLGLKVLKMVMKGLEDGSISHAVIIYKKDEQDYYASLTDSSYETLGWMLQKANIAMVVENGENEEE